MILNFLLITAMFGWTSLEQPFGVIGMIYMKELFVV